MNPQKLYIPTHRRGLIEITPQVQKVVKESGIAQGLCHVFIHHTSASLVISENADPDVLVDLDAFMHRLVPDGDALFIHTAEGVDDMPAHVRSVLTQTHLTIPVMNYRCDLGTWQGVFVWEHRTHPHQRSVTVTVT